MCSATGVTGRNYKRGIETIKLEKENQRKPLGKQAEKGSKPTNIRPLMDLTLLIKTYLQGGNIINGKHNAQQHIFKNAAVA